MQDTNIATVLDWSPSAIYHPIVWAVPPRLPALHNCSYFRWVRPSRGLGHRFWQDCVYLHDTTCYQNCSKQSRHDSYVCAPMLCKFPINAAILVVSPTTALEEDQVLAKLFTCV